MHQCPKCEKVFTRKENIDYHVLNNSCKDKKYHCKYCGAGFTDRANMYRHINHTCNEKRIYDEDEENTQTRIKEIIKNYEDSIKKNEELEKRLNKMEEDLKRESKSTKSTKLTKSVKSTKSPKSVSDINNNNNSNINSNVNNGTIINDNRVINNITMMAFGKEDMSLIEPEDIIGALKTGFNSTKKLTEAVHFNSKYPHFSNIRRNNFNMKNKIIYYNGEQWITTTNPDMIDDIYNRKRDFIEESIETYRKNLNKYDLKRLKRWLDIKDDDDYRIKKIKDDLREILFNKKGISEENEMILASANYQCIENNDDCDYSSDSITLQSDADSVEISDVTIEDNIMNTTVQEVQVSKRTGKRIAPRNGRYRKVSKAKK